MLNNNRKRNENLEINECTSRATCSISPTIAALEVIAVIFLKHLSFYLLELKKTGVENLQIQHEIVNILASLTALNEYSENELYEIVLKEYFILEEVKKTYIDIATASGQTPKLLQEVPEFDEKTTMPRAIMLGEKNNIIPDRNLEINKFVTILLLVLQSISLNLVSYSNLKEFDNEIFYQILSALNTLNCRKMTKQMLKDEIRKITQLDIELQIKIANEFLNTYSGISKVDVSHSSRKGKAILVSGNNFSNLYDILLETEGKNIDVYSHSNLLIAHAMTEFRKFEHFQGHYGSKTENCILDFATFPGAILMTKNFKNNTEYLYRGRLFSTDYIVPKGVKKIINNDFSPVIEETLRAKGFAKGKIKGDTPLGYNEEDVLAKFHEIVERLKSGSLKRLYIIGIDPLNERENAYYHDLLDSLTSDEFAISFSYESNEDNVLSINIGNYIPLMSKLLQMLFKDYSIASENITFFFTTCDVMTLSMVLAVATKGAENIFMTQCLPTVINPLVFTVFEDEYNVKVITSPDLDLDEIRRKK